MVHEVALGQVFLPVLRFSAADYHYSKDPYSHISTRGWYNGVTCGPCTQGLTVNSNVRIKNKYAENSSFNILQLVKCHTHSISVRLDDPVM
jgi:hypothetical protein